MKVIAKNLFYILVCLVVLDAGWGGVAWALSSSPSANTVQRGPTTTEDSLNKKEIKNVICSLSIQKRGADGKFWLNSQIKSSKNARKLIRKLKSSRGCDKYIAFADPYYSEIRKSYVVMIDDHSRSAEGWSLTIVKDGGGLWKIENIGRYIH